ncbi:MAG: hypothetical protein ABI823_20075, partial [Bryobacteraceae bacterium]
MTTANLRPAMQTGASDRSTDIALHTSFGNTPDPSPSGAVLQEWVRLVDRIRTGETDGMEELYKLFSRGIRFYLCRQLGPQELDDKVHDTFLVVVQA